MYLEAIFQWALGVESTSKRNEILAQGISAQVPDHWNLNVPLQFNKAKVAILAGEKGVFDNCIVLLKKTKLIK